MKNWAAKMSPVDCCEAIPHYQVLLGVFKHKNLLQGEKDKTGYTGKSAL